MSNLSGLAAMEGAAAIIIGEEEANQETKEEIPYWLKLTAIAVLIFAAAALLAGILNFHL